MRYKKASEAKKLCTRGKAFSLKRYIYVNFVGCVGCIIIISSYVITENRKRVHKKVSCISKLTAKYLSILWNQFTHTLLILSCASSSSGSVITLFNEKVLARYFRGFFGQNCIPRHFHFADQVTSCYFMHSNFTIGSNS